MRNQVFIAEVAAGVTHDRGAPLVAELLLQFNDVFPDQAANFVRVGQQVLQVPDPLHHLLVLVFDLLAFERGEPPQLQVQDCLRLDHAEIEQFNQLRARMLGALRIAYRRDHSVEELEGNAQPLQNVRTLALLVQVELGTPRDHLKAVIDVDQQRAAQAQRYRPPVQ